MTRVFPYAASDRPAAAAYIHAIGTAIPQHDIHQPFIEWARTRLQTPREHRLFERMAARSGIEHRWSVLPQGERSLLTSEAELEFKGGIFGRALALVMAPLMRRMAPGALASFKYLVEHGQPYTGKAAQLPRASTSC